MVLDITQRIAIDPETKKGTVTLDEYLLGKRDIVEFYSSEEVIISANAVIRALAETPAYIVIANQTVSLENISQAVEIIDSLIAERKNEHINRNFFSSFRNVLAHALDD